MKLGRNLAPLVGLCALIAQPLQAGAQTVSPCDGESLDPAMIVEPWEDQIASYGDGGIRVVLLDSYEPAAVPFRLMVLAPPADESGARRCHMISDGASGFSAVDFAARTSSYDPAKGLTLRFPVSTYDQALAAPRPGHLSVTINQASGEIAARMEP